MKTVVIMGQERDYLDMNYLPVNGDEFMGEWKHSGTTKNNHPVYTREGEAYLAKEDAVMALDDAFVPFSVYGHIKVREGKAGNNKYVWFVPVEGTVWWKCLDETLAN